MAITQAQTKEGVKVCIPTNKSYLNAGYTIEDFQEAIKKHGYLKPYLLIRSVWHDSASLGYDQNAGHTHPCGGVFRLSDLDLYDAEQANPTPYPLPEETYNKTVLDGFGHEWDAGTFVNATKPAHYNSTAVTALQVIDAWSLNFRLGNTIKYIARAGRKGAALPDLEKSMEYLRLEIERLKATA
jgi:hypothetical protein